MDWDNCNHKKINQFKTEAQRWKDQNKDAPSSKAKKGNRTQPAKRKKRAS